ncbi:unnamed protein product [Camellia sinensis]
MRYILERISLSCFYIQIYLLIFICICILQATTKISACQIINLRQQITKLQACLQQMSPAKQTEEETEELTNQVLDEIGVDVASLVSIRRSFFFMTLSC